MTDFQTDVAVIGAGTAGMGAFRAARAHAERVILIEGAHYGTTCARVGCMPSKLLIAAAEAVHAIEEAPVFGVHPNGKPRIDGAEVMDRVRRERDRFVGFVVESVEEFPREDRLTGCARFLDGHRIEVENNGVVTADRVVIASGSRPTYPPIFSEVEDLIVTNDDVFDWQDLPESVVVFGGGVIGLELGQALHRLGVRLRLFGRGGGVGPLSDPVLRDYAAAAFAEAFPFDPDANVSAVRRVEGQVEVIFTDRDGVEKSERFEKLLAATGRLPNVEKLGLEETGLVRDPRGVPLFDRFTLQCGDSHIFIAGDVNNDLPLLHEAADEGRIAGDNAGRFPDVLCGLRRAPLGVVFSDPQIAVAGLMYNQLLDRQADFVTGAVSFEDQGRSRVMNRNKGLLHVYGERGSGAFLGAEMIGPRAEHIGHLLAWCVQQRMTVSDMLDMPFYHPVVEEGLRTALRDLARNLKRGPAMVKRCMDCGPGA